MDNLPIELLFEITQFLDLQSQLDFRSVTTKFHKILWVKNLRQFAGLTYDDRNCGACKQRYAWLIKKNLLRYFQVIQSAGCGLFFVKDKQIKINNLDRFIDRLHTTGIIR